MKKQKKIFLKVGRIHGVYSYTFIMEQRSACSIVSIAQGLATVAEVNFEYFLNFKFEFLKARLYFFSFNIFGYCLPLGITCVLYYLMLKRLWYAPFRSSTDNNTKIPPTKVGLENFLVNAVLPWYIGIPRQNGKNQGTISDPKVGEPG